MYNFKWPSGPISVRMTSDLLFKHLLQDSEPVLQALICSLLHLDPAQINKTEVTNPILLGQEIDEKTVILDVNVLMNDNSYIDLEMQVVDYGDWAERSVFYAARNFGDLKSGDPYLIVKPSIHIGFLSFSPFKDYDKFYSMNRLMDIDDHNIYTEKLSIGYVNLTRIDLATDIDRQYNVDKWAKFFMSKTWEEIRMLAEEYPVIEEAASHLRKLSEEERFRLQQEAWEDRQRRVNGLRMQLDQANERAAKAEAEIAEAKNQAAEAKNQAAKAEAQIAEAKNQAAEAKNQAEVYRQQLIAAGITPEE